MRMIELKRCVISFRLVPLSGVKQVGRKQGGLTGRTQRSHFIFEEHTVSSSSCFFSINERMSRKVSTFHSVAFRICSEFWEIFIFSGNPHAFKSFLAVESIRGCSRGIVLNLKCPK